MRARLDATRGQAATEYLGVLVLVVVIIGTLVTSGIGDRISGLIRDEMCQLAKGEAACGDSAAERRAAARQRRTDPDGDGLSTRREKQLGLAWGRADTDGDGVPDGRELRDRLDPKSDDTDRDGLSDGEEYRRGTDPRSADEDDDGLTDAQEIALGTRPGFRESDSYGGGYDGLTDEEEVYRYGTDPLKYDTDGDGTNDGTEVREGTDPRIDERDLIDKVGPEVAGLFLDDPFGLGKGGAARKGIDKVKDLVKRLVGKGGSKEAAERAVEEAEAAGVNAVRRRAAADRAKPGAGVDIAPGKDKKIFADRPGHVPDTPENRALILDTARDPDARLGTDRFGNEWSATTRPDGSQVWVQTRGDKIINAGVNREPRPFNDQTGLSRPEKPKGKSP